MSVAVVLTDLDGTLLEPDGSARDEVRSALAALAARGIPVCPVTSKTAPEVRRLAAELGLTGPAGLENGAAVLAGGRVRTTPAAVGVERLREVLDELRRATGAPVRSVEELDDTMLARLTTLPADRLAAVRERTATLPLVVDEGWDERLRAALPPQRPALRLVRGNRFLHLQGDHAKADVVPALLEAAATRPGLVVALGDAPNDEEMLAAAHLPVIVPSSRGPHPALVARLPHAIVAPAPHGLGWAAAISVILQEVGAQ